MSVTVCVPTLNAAGMWQKFWSALQSQILQPLEVLVLDSSSTDGTAELARRSGCRVITVRRDDFRHGGTRQYAARLAENADVLVYLTQDAILADKDALSRLTGVFEDTSIGAAYGRQLPRPGSNPIAAHARFFNYPAESTIRSLDSVGASGLKTIFFSNSFGAYRREALLEVGGFPCAMNFGEDTDAAAVYSRRDTELLMWRRRASITRTVTACATNSSVIPKSAGSTATNPGCCASSAEPPTRGADSWFRRSAISSVMLRG